MAYNVTVTCHCHVFWELQMPPTQGPVLTRLWREKLRLRNPVPFLVRREQLPLLCDNSIQQGAVITIYREA